MQLKRDERRLKRAPFCVKDTGKNAHARQIEVYSHAADLYMAILALVQVKALIGKKFKFQLEYVSLELCFFKT